MRALNGIGTVQVADARRGGEHWVMRFCAVPLKKVHSEIYRSGSVPGLMKKSFKSCALGIAFLCTVSDTCLQ